MIRTVAELREARIAAGLSQQALADHIGCSQPTYWRIEDRPGDRISVVRLSEMASLLGLELAVRLYPAGDPIRDKGQQALAKRFGALLSPRWQVTTETLLPMPGDLRSWDKLLRLTGPAHSQLVGADLETRIRDIQALVRRTRLRERDGGVDVILIVLSDSATNRRMVDELRVALGPDYATSPRILLRALRTGEQLPGSGVILI